MVWINVIIIVHIIVALAIIALVLLQHGKGADMGSGFGGGASSSLFGATGSANFLSRATGVLATIFFVLSLALAYLASTQQRGSGSVVDRVQRKPAAEKQAEKPAAPAPEAKGEKPADTPKAPEGSRQVPQ
jgi:preprotein translocase subunit SecG